MQRQHLFSRFQGEQLVEALAASMTFDIRGIDAYGLFDASTVTSAAPCAIRSTCRWTARSTCSATAPTPTTRPARRQLRRGGDPNRGWPLAGAGARQRLVVRRHPDHPACIVLGRVPDHPAGHCRLALVAPPPAAAHSRDSGQRRGHRRRRPDHRLPLSNRRDELDMLAAIVNAMLDRIER
jgi:hypothetical protein